MKQRKFSIDQSSPTEIRVYDETSGYDLLINTGNPICFRHLMFDVPHVLGPYISSRNGRRIFRVTGRDLGEYICFPKGKFPNLEGQCVEVGAGFGELIPYIAINNKGHSSKPIAIDPANYELMIEILKKSQELELSHGLLSKISSWITRGNIILDPSKVKLINLPLVQAIEQNPYLTGCADVVVDYMGARVQGHFYHGGGVAERLELSMLKPNGRIFPEYMAESYGSKP